MRLLVFLLSLLFALGTAHAEDDADTLTVDGSRYRLDGIDAPELDQPCLSADGEIYLCGRKAYEELQKFVGNKVVRCDACVFSWGQDPSNSHLAAVLVRTCVGDVMLAQKLALELFEALVQPDVTPIRWAGAAGIVQCQGVDILTRSANALVRCASREPSRFPC